MPFGGSDRAQVLRSRHAFLPDGVEFVIGAVDRVDDEADVVRQAEGRALSYDQLVVASGTTPRPDQTPGMLGSEWRRSIFDFDTLEGAEALAKALTTFDGGRLVVHITETRSSAPSRHWSSRSWPKPGCASSACATGSSWST